MSCEWKPCDQFNCNEKIVGTQAAAGFKYCPYCGQEIDWKDHDSYKPTRDVIVIAQNNPDLDPEECTTEYCDDDNCPEHGVWITE